MRMTSVRIARAAVRASLISISLQNLLNHSNNYIRASHLSYLITMSTCARLNYHQPDMQTHPPHVHFCSGNTDDFRAYCQSCSVYLSYCNVLALITQKVYQRVTFIWSIYYVYVRSVNIQPTGRASISPHIHFCSAIRTTSTPIARIKSLKILEATFILRNYHVDMRSLNISPTRRAYTSTHIHFCSGNKDDFCAYCQSCSAGISDLKFPANIVEITQHIVSGLSIYLM